MSKTVLVVDDDRMSTELVRRMLTEKGFSTLTAVNGEAALAVIRQKNPTPDLILLDVEMPVMNGYTFMQERSKDEAVKAIPVIVLTSHPENEPLFKRYGVKGYLPKPLNTQVMIDKINLVFGLPNA